MQSMDNHFPSQSMEASWLTMRTSAYLMLPQATASSMSSTRSSHQQIHQTIFLEQHNVLAYIIRWSPVLFKQGCLRLCKAMARSQSLHQPTRRSLMQRSILQHWILQKAKQRSRTSCSITCLKEKSQPPQLRIVCRPQLSMAILSRSQSVIL